MSRGSRGPVSDDRGREASIEPELMLDFGRRLAELRRTMQLTQEMFAQGYDGDRTYIGKIERGKQFPDLAYVERVADAYEDIRGDLLDAWYAVDSERASRRARPGRGERGESGHFTSFVGSEIARVGVTLVYPAFQLADSTLSVLSAAGIPRQHYYGKKGTAFRAQHRIDVPVAVAENDVRALIYVSSVLQRYTSVKLDICSDYEVIERCDRSFVSFGLSSNDCTHMYLEQSASPLFAIKDDNDPESPLYLEYLELSDGRCFRSTDEVNIGIILRTHPDPQHRPARRWFYCAGLGPRGTSGAGWYFANNWRLLHSKVQNDDFVAVLKVRAYSDQTAQLEHLYISRSSPQGI
jgi:transcriptional regulator with XRE-family HTH domain